MRCCVPSLSILPSPPRFMLSPTPRLHPLCASISCFLPVFHRGPTAQARMSPIFPYIPTTWFLVLRFRDLLPGLPPGVIEIMSAYKAFTGRILVTTSPQHRGHHWAQGESAPELRQAWSTSAPVPCARAIQTPNRTCFACADCAITCQVHTSRPRARLRNQQQEMIETHQLSTRPSTHGVSKPCCRSGGLCLMSRPEGHHQTRLGSVGPRKQEP